MQTVTPDYGWKMLIGVDFTSNYIYWANILGLQLKAYFNNEQRISHVSLMRLKFNEKKSKNRRVRRPVNRKSIGLCHKLRVQTSA